MPATAHARSSKKTEEKKPKFAQFPAVFTAIPAEGLAYLIKNEKLSGMIQVAVLAAISEATFSKSRKARTAAPEWGRVEVKAFAKSHGCKQDYAEIVFADAAERGLCERKRDPDDERFWLYRMTPDRWESVPRYIPKPMPVPKDLAPTVETVEPDPTSTVEADEKPRLVKSKPIEVAPGAATRPIALDPAKDKALRVTNDTTFDLEVSKKRDPKGALFLSITAKLPPLQWKSEEALSERIQRDRQVEDFVKANFSVLYGKVPEPEFIADVKSRLGSAPFAVFEFLATTDLQLRIRRNNKPGSGIFRSYADQARDKYEKDEAENLQRAREARAKAAEGTMVTSRWTKKPETAMEIVRDWDKALDIERQWVIENFPEMVPK